MQLLLQDGVPTSITRQGRRPNVNLRRAPHLDLDSPAINWPNTIGSVLNCWRTGRLQRTLQHSFKAVQHSPVGVMMNDKKQWTGLESLVCEAACPEVQKQSEMMLNIFETTAYARIYTAPQQQPNPETAC